MEHCTSIVEQELNIENLEGFVAIQDDALAALEASRAFQFELMGTFKVLGDGGAQDPGRHLEIREGGAFLPVHHHPDQDLTQFRPAMGTDHDRLAALEVGRIRGESAHLTPHTVSDQVHHFHAFLPA
jgi:hypothetical protein